MHIAVNMASTIDGKIAPASRGPVKLGSTYDSQRMAEIRAKVGAVVIGGATFRAHPFGLTTKLRKKQPITVIVSGSADLPKRTTALERARGLTRIFFCGAGAKPAAIKRLKRAGIEVISVKTLRVTAHDIVRVLRARGVRRILLEGGGELNSVFFEKNLVDRIYLTLCPSLLGGSQAPTFFEGRGFSLNARSRWRLHQCRKVGQELYLIYDSLR